MDFTSGKRITYRTKDGSVHFGKILEEGIDTLFVLPLVYGRDKLIQKIDVISSKDSNPNRNRTQPRVYGDIIKRKVK